MTSMTPEQMALSFTGECEPALHGICGNHRSPLGAAKTCLHVLHLTELIRDRDAEMQSEVNRLLAGIEDIRDEAWEPWLNHDWQHLDTVRNDCNALLNPTEGETL